MNYRIDSGTFDKMLFEKILNGGSIRDELYVLRKMARDCIERATIVSEAKNVIELLNAIQKLLRDNPDSTEVDVIIREINKKYDIVHDDLFIVAAFENYAKALLLSKRYIVHRIQKPDVLAKRQKSFPIHFSTVRSKIYKNSVFIDNFTLNIENLLKPKYVAIIGMSRQELDALKICRSIRNSIHFGGPRVWGYHTKMLEGLAPLKERIIHS